MHSLCPAHFPGFNLCEFMPFSTLVIRGYNNQKRGFPISHTRFKKQKQVTISLSLVKSFFGDMEYGGNGCPSGIAFSIFSYTSSGRGNIRGSYGGTCEQIKTILITGTSSWWKKCTESSITSCQNTQQRKCNLYFWILFTMSDQKFKTFRRLFHMKNKVTSCCHCICVLRYNSTDQQPITRQHAAMNMLLAEVIICTITT